MPKQWLWGLLLDTASGGEDTMPTWKLPQDSIAVPTVLHFPHEPVLSPVLGEAAITLPGNS